MLSISHARFATAAIGLAIAKVLLVGCADQPTPTSTAVDQVAAIPVPLKLVVIDDPPLAQAIQRQGHAHSTAGLSVQDMTSMEFGATPDALDADAVVFPSCLLGEMTERRLIRPLPKSLLDDEGFARAEIFDLVRLHETRWARQVYAVPFGSPQLVLVVRTDILERLEESPPATWGEYDELIQRFRRASTPAASTAWPAYPAVEPLAAGWAGRTLLVRAAPYIYNRSRYSTVFDFRTMEPLVDRPPFVRALDELTSAYQAGPPEAISFSPEETMQFFLSGKSAMAVGWPTASRSGDIKTSRHEPPRFVELPGSDVSFDFVAEQWVQRPRDEPRHVPVLAVAGRLGAITRQSRQISSAANLLGWLSGRQHSDTIGTRSPATTLFRQSHLTEPSRWVDPTIESAAAHEYGQLVARTQSRAEFVLAPRLPGQHLYMEALDTAVRQAVQGQVAPQEALHEAARIWRQITAQLGLEAQRSAYHHSLGLD